MSRRVCLALIAAGFTLLSVWPIVFAGKSFVSPNFGTRLLYSDFPTIPGSDDRQAVPARNSDVGASTWQDVPYSAVQARSLFKDRELPLWNRYGSGGSPLLAQGQSMLGDPLHWLPIFGQGAAWAWDLKFVLAKVLFATAIAWLVFDLSGSFFAAGVCGAAAPFIGFFLFAINHPAFFSFCYAPWVLLAWLRRSPVLLFVANLALVCSGTVKEAYFLALVMNTCGALAVLAAPSSRGRRLGPVLACGVATLLAGGATLPSWGSLLGALPDAYVTAAGPGASLLPPSLALGLFDEAFFRPLVPGSGVYEPALSFVFLGGLLYFFATLRLQWRDPVTGVILAFAIGLASLMCGLVPASVIAGVPFLGQLGHFDSVAACGLLPLLAILAGRGLARAESRLGGPEGVGDLAIAVLLLLGLVVLYSSFLHVLPRTYTPRGNFGLIDAQGPVAVDRHLLAYGLALVVTLVLVGVIFRLGSRSRAGAAVAAAAGVGAFCLFNWQGMQAAEETSATATGMDALRVRPPQRPDFARPSPAMRAVRQRLRTEPGRVAGVNIHLFPGWAAFEGLEAISGPDALMNRRYRELIDAMQLDRRMDWMICLKREDIAAKLRDLDFLNLRYYVDDPGAAPARPDLRAVMTADLSVYESPTAWPRAFFVTHVEPGGNASQLVERIEHGSGRPFAQIEPGGADGVAPGLFSGPAADAVPATHYRLTENSTSFEVEAGAAGLCVLTEALWPGYPHAEMDGKPVRTVRVNHAFIGIPIATAGNHRLTIAYRPRHFLLREMVSLGSFALAGGLILFRRSRSETTRRNGEGPPRAALLARSSPPRSRW